MALNINTNITSLLATKTMDANGRAMAKTFERLISGSRLNNAGDDPAGFSVSQRLTAKIRGSNFAVRNAQDAISVTQVADSAMQETANALQKMRDLMVGAGNPSVSSSDRAAMQEEVQGLISEIQRIATGTNFNGKKLLNGSYNAQRVLVGAEVTEVFSFSIGGMSKEALGIVLGDTLASFDGSALTNAEVGQNISTNLTRIDAAISSVSTIRARLGAVQNRFNGVVTGLESLITATTESRSRILDTDMAAEAAEMVKQQIKQQVGAAILSQANNLPGAVLTLLR